MLDQLNTNASGLWVETPEQPNIAQLVYGKNVQDVSELLPRIFNLCRHAQTTAINLALGLDVPSHIDITAEIRQEHLLRLAVLLPVRLGLPSLPVAGLPSENLALALFDAKRFPDTPQAFEAFLQTNQGLAPLMRAIRDGFTFSEATAQLPLVTPATALSRIGVENSAAARHIDHPVLQAIEAGFGRGPFWRVVGRALDLQATIDGTLPHPEILNNGTAIVPAARGFYAVQARVEAGRVQDLKRVTPTDHLLAEGGIMTQSLASLPPAKHDLGELVVDILDPCMPVRLKRTRHA